MIFPKFYLTYYKIALVYWHDKIKIRAGQRKTFKEYCYIFNAGWVFLPTGETML